MLLIMLYNVLPIHPLRRRHTRTGFSLLVLLDPASAERIEMRSVINHTSPRSRRDTHASSTSHSSSITVRSRMKLLVVSTTSWYITQPVDGCRVNMTDDGWTCSVAPSRAERYVPSGIMRAAFCQ